MIDRIAADPLKCTGCGACAAICPTENIIMDYSREGFLMPSIGTKCIDCKLCQKRCPANKPVELHPMLEAWAASSVDKAEILNGCTSGGVAFELSREVIDRGGVVFGACFSEDCLTVHHCAANELDQLQKFKGSKYIQSEPRNCYQETKTALKEGKVVLYTGTPCQIAGLYSFLGKEYENLFTMDFMCHGIMSTFAYQSFLKSIKLHLPIKKITFRSKEQGYCLESPIIITDSKECEYRSPWIQSLLGIGFANNLLSRESCSICQYASCKRAADLTVADFIDTSNSEEENRSGVSLVTVNTKKGGEMLYNIEKNLEIRALDLDFIKTYKHFAAPAEKHKNRDAFFDQIDSLPYNVLAQKYFTPYEPCFSISKLGKKLIKKMRKIAKIIIRK